MDRVEFLEKFDVVSKGLLTVEGQREEADAGYKDFDYGLAQIRAGWDLVAAGLCSKDQAEGFVEELTERVVKGELGAEEPTSYETAGAEFIAITAVNEIVPRSERTEGILAWRADVVAELRAGLGV